MNYHNITKCDMLNGEGIRVVLWVAGCLHHCKNCQNPETWDPNGGILFDNAAKKELFEELQKKYVTGITFSGGDPLHPDNLPIITALAGEIKRLFPDKNIWLYTGSSWTEIKFLKIMKYVDVVVDGEYIEEKRNVNLHWKGSANQKVIDVKESLETGKIVLME